MPKMKTKPRRTAGADDVRALLAAVERVAVSLERMERQQRRAADNLAIIATTALADTGLKDSRGRWLRSA